MRLVRWVRYLGLGYLALATSYSAKAPKAGAQGMPNEVPTIADLKSGRVALFKRWMDEGMAP